MAVPPSHILHSGYAHELTRSWQSGITLSADQLIYPLFVTDKEDAKDAIVSLPGQYQLSVSRISDYVAPLVEKGLRSVLLFGVITKPGTKDSSGSHSKDASSPVCLATQELAKRFPKLCIVADVCLCAYTDHGHCGLLHPDGSIDNTKSIAAISEMALAFARAGVHVVAPSDMMDGRVGAIKAKLGEHSLGSKVAVMAYSAKFASTLYGPFRDAAASAPQFGDRKAYQLPPFSRGLAIRAVKRDLEEGADFVMVKPATLYMDIIREVKDFSPVPVCCYHVSGEYAMLWHAAAAGGIDLKAASMETLLSLRRAGADIIITYLTPLVLSWLSETK